MTALLDRLLHHGHVLKCGPRSWRTKNRLAAPGVGGVKNNKSRPLSLASFALTTVGGF